MPRKGTKLSAKSQAKKKAYAAEYYAANKDAIREKWIVRRYGITVAEFDAIWDEQDGSCAICQLPFEGTADARIDHDHACCSGITSCGRCIRGLLCQKCNAGLGMFQDDAARMLRAVEYLDQGTTVS